MIRELHLNKAVLKRHFIGSIWQSCEQLATGMTKAEDKSHWDAGEASRL